jgi:hypothetical protein
VPVTSNVSWKIWVTFSFIVGCVRAVGVAVKPSTCAFDADARRVSSIQSNAQLWTVSLPVSDVNGAFDGEMLEMMSETSSFF